ncbi:MAG: chalcone isomerase family protein [Myxococcaceae bacterium]
MRTAFLLAVVLVAVPAFAKEAGGAKLPDTTTVEGKTLQLKGMGLRTKFVFKVYAAGLYVEDATLTADAIISADQVRRVHLVMLRDVDKKTAADAYVEGISKNAKAKLPSLKERLDKFAAALPDAKSGDQLIFTYVPGKGLVGSGKVDFTIEGKDFADAVFAMWLGKEPVDEGLKKGMLGQ